MEEWHNVIGYEGLYEVSNYGNVRSLTRQVKVLDHFRVRKGYNLVKNHSRDRLRVTLYKNGTKKMFCAHRLVAEAFLENPQNKPFINHKDNNPGNNYYRNLEWCTQKENMQHSLKQGRMKIPNRRLLNLSIC